MIKVKDKAYEELDNTLKLYLEKSQKSIPIDESAKERIWNNLHSEIQEERMNSRFRVSRKVKACIAACIVCFLMISIDLTTNASLFRRLLTTFNDNVIMFSTRSAKSYEEERNIELDQKIAKLNAENDTQFISPAVPNKYLLKEVVLGSEALSIILNDHNNSSIIIKERNITNGQLTTSIEYDKKNLESEVVNKNGIEYTLLKGNNINMSIFLIGDIEFEIIGKVHEDVLELAFLQE
ncbi:MAG: DUF4367 domain-containing protein [Vallitalea sp.]|jgi:hypothetical protein|nr:DUF4367 domain-containing protein [Vallitalea sp.]